MSQPKPDYEVRIENGMVFVKRSGEFWSNIEICKPVKDWEPLITEAQYYWPNHDAEQVAAGYAWGRW